MNQSQLPYKLLVFVCTNARKSGERISCAGEGRCGQEILDKLKSYVKEHGLEKQIRVAKSGCHEKCEVGPNIVVLPDNKFITDITKSDIELIINEYLSPHLTT